ncbi:MAG: response regulator [Eggerthellaceae bacterium]|nr:response regulator [Eggerthellaceae bacterium]
MTPSLNRKKTVLVVDDSPMNRELLIDIMGDEFNVVEAENGEQAVAAVLRLGLGVSLVLLDYVMPGMDGLEVLEVFQKNGWIKDIPVVMLSTESDPKYIERAYELGATDFLVRPFDANIVLHRARNTIMLYSKQRMLYGMVADEINERERDVNLMVAILSHIVEFRNGESGRHVLRVRMLTELLLTYLADKTDAYNLTPDDISLISMASSLHDIGKIAISEAILNKPGRLAPEEFEVMKTHAAVGAEMLENLPMGQGERLVQTAHDICRWHHERWDGRGYPDGLKGDDIPISAQVVALADVYDALTSERVYKPPYPHGKALDMILNGECGTFNPLLLDCLRENADDICSQVEDVSLDGNRVSDSGYTMRYVADSLAESMDEGKASREFDLMEYERMKYAFFAEMSNEIQFEYAADPSMLIISSHGTMNSGLPDIVADPIDDERMTKMFRREDLLDLDRRLRATSPENPIVNLEMKANLNGKPRRLAVVARSLWSEEDEPAYVGALGKIADVHDGRATAQSIDA